MIQKTYFALVNKEIWYFEISSDHSAFQNSKNTGKNDIGLVENDAMQAQKQLDALQLETGKVFLPSRHSWQTDHHSCQLKISWHVRRINITQCSNANQPRLSSILETQVNP